MRLHIFLGGEGDLKDLLFSSFSSSYESEWSAEKTHEPPKPKTPPKKYRLPKFKQAKFRNEQDKKNYLRIKREIDKNYKFNPNEKIVAEEITRRDIYKKIQKGYDLDDHEQKIIDDHRAKKHRILDQKRRYQKLYAKFHTEAAQMLLSLYEVNIPVGDYENTTFSSQENSSADYEENKTRVRYTREELKVMEIERRIQQRKKLGGRSTPTQSEIEELKKAKDECEYVEDQMKITNQLSEKQEKYRQEYVQTSKTFYKVPKHYYDEHLFYPLKEEEKKEE